MDILDASTGRLLSQLVDANLSTICPVNKPHPRIDVIMSGSSRSLYAWRPVSKGALLHSYNMQVHTCPWLQLVQHLKQHPGCPLGTIPAAAASRM